MPVAPERVARAFAEIGKLVAADPAAPREIAGYLETKFFGWFGTRRGRLRL